MAKKSKNNFFNEMISLDHFIFPKILWAIYLLVMVIIVIYGLVALVMALMELSLMGMIMALVTTGVGLLVLRLYAELVLVIFAIEKNTRKLRK